MRSSQLAAPELHLIIGDDTKTELVLNLLRERTDFFNGLSTEKQVYAYTNYARTY